MKRRLQDKISEITKYLEELDSVKPGDFKEYESDIKTKAACERYFEKIMEAVTDLAFLLIRYKRLEMPEDDKDAFNILLRKDIIGSRLCVGLKEAKGMRNIISHQYGRIDDRLVFESITAELHDDVNDFIKAVKKLSL